MGAGPPSKLTVPDLRWSHRGHTRGRVLLSVRLKVTEGPELPPRPTTDFPKGGEQHSGFTVYRPHVTEVIRMRRKDRACAPLDLLFSTLVGREGQDLNWYHGKNGRRGPTLSVATEKVTGDPGSLDHCTSPDKKLKSLQTRFQGVNC